MKLSIKLLAAAIIVSFLSNAKAGTIVVNELGASVSGYAGWAHANRGGGTSSLVDLTGQGGNLESGQPLPTGAAKLTTGADNADGGEIAIAGDFGSAAAVLNNLIAGYSYFKVDNGPNIFAAPSLKLAVSAAGGTGDNYGQLIYEPSWNQPVGGSVAPPTDSWQTVSIDSSTGSASNSSGGWWWTGGFEQPNGGGGPPIRSASEWAGLFAADSDFANAKIVGISVGVGTYNQNQIGYVDAVTFGTTTGGTTVYNFQPAAVVPEPMSGFVFAGLGLIAIGRRRRS
ncbi:hypothetical protein [Roseiconus lacunae]|uniref:hypothetical protein n=1 Tax=Roseiconus lacunae TaxID=2605694 RepID=UPI001E4EE69E|nr:hypothetical protein [Roseiconus lacunae]MCD0463722.1 hypothetical protein [Roseiconus lacunae]